MKCIPNINHNETLRLITEAVCITVRMGHGKKLDPFLARLYEEKGHVLRLLGCGVT